MYRFVAAFLVLTVGCFSAQAQTVTPVLSQPQEDFIKALCLTAANDPDTPGELLPPGLTAEQFADACVVVAFYIANWKDFKDKFNLLTDVVTANQQTLAVNGANISSNTLAVAGVQAQVSANTSQVAVNTPAIAALDARVAALESPPPQGFFNGFEGADFNAWLVPIGTSLAVNGDAFAGAQSGRIGYGGSASPKSFNETGGVAIEIPETFALSYGGKTITVSFRAKRPSTGASSQFAVSYSTDDVGNSGWQQFIPTANWQPFLFTYAVPIPNAGGTDFLGFWGDTSNSGLAVLIDDVQIIAP